jgi:gluconokinase
MGGRRVSTCVVMGVSGCGKSTVARALAEKTGGVYLDADDFHPPANKEKMAAGIPLTDDDRWGWLDALNQELRKRSAERVFLACSALKEIYRERLRSGVPKIVFVYLKGSREVLVQRLGARKGHFMPSTLLDSQLATLEEPDDAIVVNIDQPPEAVIAEAGRALASQADS